MGRASNSFPAPVVSSPPPPSPHTCSLSLHASPLHWQLHGLESKGKVGEASKELEAAGAPRDPEEEPAAATTATAAAEEPKEDLGGNTFHP